VKIAINGTILWVLLYNDPRSTIRSPKIFIKMVRNVHFLCRKLLYFSNFYSKILYKNPLLRHVIWHSQGGGFCRGRWQKLRLRDCRVL